MKRKHTQMIKDSDLVIRLGGEVFRYATAPTLYKVFSQYCYNRATRYSLNLKGRFYGEGYNVIRFDQVLETL